MLGQIIVTLTSAGWGMEAPLKVSHVVTFVKRLICRNARHKRRHIVFKMGQAGNGEKS
jgi:hypothetical protein